MNVKLNKNNKVLITAILTILFAITFSGFASAFTVSEKASAFTGLLDKYVFSQIKSDFCKQYILAISNGEWKDGEFRSNLGKKTCTSYNVPSSSKPITPSSLLNINANDISKTENLSTSSVNNPKPEIIVTNSDISKNLSDSQIVIITNQERKKIDSTFLDLKTSSILKNIAAIRVKDMFDKQYFDHNSPTGDNASKEALKNGYSYVTIGENIALGNFDGSKGVVTEWMNSPGHRANILNKNYKEIGVYSEQGLYKGQKVWIAAQIFGKPLSNCKEPNKETKNNIEKYRASADDIFSNIKKIDEELKIMDMTQVQIYNSKVTERNTLAGLYNNLAVEIKTLVSQYNKSVATYNACIKTL